MTGAVVWVTGLPSSGKSTFAIRARERLQARGLPVCVLDGDEVRAALVPPPGYGEAERDRFYETLARMAALLALQGLVVLVAATANRRLHRDRARARSPRFFEIHVATPPEECARRDAKGLYAAAAEGAIHGLPGRDAVYEPPEAPLVVAEGGHDEAAIERLLEALAAPVMARVLQRRPDAGDARGVPRRRPEPFDPQPEDNHDASQ